MPDVNFVIVVTLLMLILYMVFTGKAGLARGRFGVKAPATSGHPDFERYLRVQLNTLEQMVIVLPAMWLFAFLISAFWAAILGLVWMVGRVIYAIGYYKAADKRHPGSFIGTLSVAILVLGSLVVAIANLFKS